LKAIIVAAGPGSRLKPFTDDKPKCLLEIGGQTIIQRTLETLRENGINKIIVVRGYHGDLIDYQDLIYYENPRFVENNILESLFCAEAEMDGDFIFSYSDILYSSEIVSKLLHNEAEITLTVDTGWMSRYRVRDQHPVAEAELVKVEGGKVVSIGKGVVDPEDAHGEFIGLAKFTKLGAEAMKTAYYLAAGRGPTVPFQQAASLEKAYITDIIQELIDTDNTVKTVDIDGGWMEIDTSQDLAEARKRFSATV
jgi:choline kinase